MVEPVVLVPKMSIGHRTEGIAILPGVLRWPVECKETEYLGVLCAGVPLIGWGVLSGWWLLVIIGGWWAIRDW